MRPRLVAVAFVLAAVLAAQQAPGPTEAEFDAGQAAVHALMQKAKWGDARKGLLELVQAHAQHAYVQAQAAAIAEDLRTCTFLATAKVKTIRDVLTGKVVSYDEASGRIKVVYSENFADWQGEGELLVNPMVFAGAYTITAAKDAYPDDDRSFRLVFDIDPMGDGWFVADFGFAQQERGHSRVWLDAAVTRSKGGNDEHVIIRDRSLAKPGKPFTAIVRVGEDRVELLLDSKSMLKCKREKTDLGQVGIWKGSCKQVTLEGRVEPAFLQGRIDEDLDRQREAFDQTFDARKELPPWLFERPAIARTAPRSGPLDQVAVSKAFVAVLALRAAGKHAEAMAKLAKLTDRDAPPAARAIVEAMLELATGQPERAEAICAKLLAADPQQSDARTLRAGALEATGRSGDAARELETVVRDDPGFFPAWQGLCVLRLRQERPDDARRLVREAKTKHGLWEEVAEIERMLAMAARGPNWPRRYSYQSRHYEIVSDIDRKVCVEASRVLEESYVNLMSQLTWIKEDQSLPRFRVFLFAGEAGYQEYNKAIVGGAVPHSAGLYTPVLKQLLIWNLPRREDMVRTIRHEGFHQFLDRLMPNPPSWLNEGMAEFWETAQREQGRIQGGQVRPDHIATLVRSRKALPKFEQFIHGDAGDFYANAQLRYAQAWALVHFLRKGPAAYTARFDRLWTELRSAKSTRAAVEAAFGGVDWAKLEQDFWAHLLSLK